MRRKWRVVALIAIALVIGLGIKNFLDGRAKRRRQAQYAAVLTRYSTALSPGMSRSEAEQYLKAKGDVFGQICCIAGPQRAWADRVKIGEVPAPWYCNKYNIYVGLEFKRTEMSEAFTDARGSDRLEKVVLYPQLEQCL
jgi:hypothetical protein